jgi:hypothetical protein
MMEETCWRQLLAAASNGIGVYATVALQADGGFERCQAFVPHFHEIKGLLQGQSVKSDADRSSILTLMQMGESGHKGC